MSIPRHILAIECSNPGSGAGDGSGGPGVAIGLLHGDRAELLSMEPVRPSGRGGHDDDLMPAIDRLFRRIGARPQSGTLARVAVSVGPGGYTSVRVACAAGKMIAEAVGATCAAVPTAQVAIESLPESVRAGHVAVALAGKGESAWVQDFRAGREVSAGRVLTASDLESLCAAGLDLLVADSFLPAAMRAGAQRAGVPVAAPIFDAAACLRLGSQLPELDPADLMPIYPREPDAVTLWRNRKSS